MLEEDDQTKKKVEIIEAAALNENNKFKQRNNRWRLDKQEKWNCYYPQNTIETEKLK